MAPELIPVEHWLNSKPLQLKELRGKVILIHFYAFQCHNCHANFKHYNTWQEEFGGDQVVVIGIQTPETSTERDPQAVTAAAKERGFQFRYSSTSESANWKAWSNTMWPTIYVIDKQGYIRYLWQGKLNWQGPLTTRRYMICWSSWSTKTWSWRHQSKKLRGNRLGNFDRRAREMC
ncbi:MAG: redoxin domain-containing protein [Pirellulaceae bacterium]